MKRSLATLALAALFLLPGGIANANVVRPTPDFTLEGGRTAKSLRGQPIIVIVAPSATSKAFRNQVKRLERDYSELSARSAVFVAVFTQDNTTPIRSSIPFAIVRNGPAVAATLGAQGPFLLGVIGIDGNLDLATAEVSSAWKIRDAILNNYAVQAAERRN